MMSQGTKRRTYHLYHGDLQRTTNNYERGSSTSSTCTTTTHGRNSADTIMEPYQSDSEMVEELEEIKTAYRQSLQRPMPPWIVSEVSDAITTGVCPYYYVYALREAAAAPRPSWQYAMAIVRRLCREKVPAMTIMYTLNMAPDV